MTKLSDIKSFAEKNLPTGTVVPHASSTVPDGFLACDGTAVSRTTYANLFTVIGTTFGAGDGSTTFNTPDLRGIFVRGVGSQVISSVTYDGSTLGTKRKDRTNNSGVTAATTSTNSASVSSNNDAHTHSWTDRFLNDTQGVLVLSYSEPGTGVSLVQSYSNVETGRTTGNPNVSLNHTHSVATNTVSSSTSFGAGDAESVPGYLTTAYMIKV